MIGINMGVQRLSAVDFATLEIPGLRSVQIVWPKNEPEALVTITRLTMEPVSISARRSHPNSAQIWIVERGRATLLVDHDQTDEVQAGDVVRTPAGSIHGVNNTGMSRLSIWPSVSADAFARGVLWLASAIAIGTRSECCPWD